MAGAMRTEESMSVQDTELDDPCRECEQCGEWCDRRICRECRADLVDEYMEWKQEHMEGRGI